MTKHFNKIKAKMIEKNPTTSISVGITNHKNVSKTYRTPFFCQPISMYPALNTMKVGGSKVIHEKDIAINSVYLITTRIFYKKQ